MLVAKRLSDHSVLQGPSLPGIGLVLCNAVEWKPMCCTVPCGDVVCTPAVCCTGHVRLHLSTVQLQRCVPVVSSSCRSRQAAVLARKRREYLDMVPEFYDIENSQRTEDEIGALRQVCGWWEVLCSTAPGSTDARLCPAVTWQQPMRTPAAPYQACIGCLHAAPPPSVLVSC